MKKLIKCLVTVALIAVLCALPAHHGAAPAEPKAATLSAAKTAKPAAKPDPKPVATTTPAAPVETPAATSPAPVQAQPAPTVYPAGCQLYLPLVQQYDWNVSVAMAIMQAESGCDPNQVSPASINYDGVPDYGLFQLHGLDIMNPADNVSYAYYHKYVPAGGFRPWSTYTSGRYLRFLN